MMSNILWLLVVDLVGEHHQHHPLLPLVEEAVVE
jgi:hypothetical protein